MGFLLKPKAGIASYLQGALSYDAATTDPLSGTINDLNVANSGDVSVILLNATAAFTINGIVGGVANRQLELVNQSGFTGTLGANAAGSQAANRFAGAATIPTGTTVQLVYNGTLNLWCVTAGSSAGGGGVPAGVNTQVQFNNNGAFGASAAFTYTIGSQTLQVGSAGVATISAPSLTINTSSTSVANFTATLASATAANSAGGLFSFTSGDGLGSGQGGSITFATGNGGQVTGTGSAGDFIINTGFGGVTGGSGGNITFSLGGANAGNSAGGTLSVLCGASTGSGNGGGFSVTSGSAVDTGSGGSISIIGGGGGGTSGTGGTLLLSAGDASAGNSNGGSAVISSGAKAGSGSNGTLSLKIANVTKALLDGNGNFSHIAAICDTSVSYQVPTTGFTITIANNITSLNIDPAGTLATGTINLPATPVDGQIIEVATTQTVTALTIAAAGKTLNNAPTTLVAGSGFSYRYRLSSTTWYRRY